MPFWKKRPAPLPPVQTPIEIGNAPISPDGREQSATTEIGPTDAGVAVAHTPPISMGRESTVARESSSLQPVAEPATPIAGKTWVVSQSGSGDFETIADAMDATSDGDKILIRKGQYRETIAISKAVQIVGEGKAQTNLTSNTIPEMVIISTDDSIRCSSVGISLENMVFLREARMAQDDRTPCLSAEGGQVEIKNSAFAGNASTSLAIRNAGVSLVNCAIAEAAGSIIADEHSRVSITESRLDAFIEVVGSSVLSLKRSTINSRIVFKDGGSFDSIEDCHISGLDVTGDITGVLTGGSILGLGIHDGAGIIVENTVLGGEGVVVISSNARPVLRRNLIVSTIMVNTNAAPLIEENDFRATLAATYSGAPQVFKNKFTQCKGSAIHIEDANGVFSDNDIFENGDGVDGAAILAIGSSSPTFTRNNVRNNSGYGFLISRGARCQLEHNFIAGSNVGVGVSDGAVADLVGNRICKNVELGLSFEGGARGSLEDNDLRGNIGQNLGIADDSIMLFDINQVDRLNRF